MKDVINTLVSENGNHNKLQSEFDVVFELSIMLFNHKYFY
jgi:hypothetical protein